MSVFLHAFPIDVARVVRLATRERLLPPGDDLGYAIHAMFAATFATDAPRCWAFLAPGRGGGPNGRLLAYSERPLDELKAVAAKFADPSFSAPIGLEYAESKRMPTFAAGDRVRVRVRLRPVVRKGVDRPDHVSDRSPSRERGRERDAYLAAVDASTAAGLPPEDRYTCYARWTLPRLTDSGLSVQTVAVDAFRLTRILSRDRGGAAPVSRSPNGPDVEMIAAVTVDKPSAFSSALVSGIGRFRAFGFGMMLLSPPAP